MKRRSQEAIQQEANRVIAMHHQRMHLTPVEHLIALANSQGNKRRDVAAKYRITLSKIDRALRRARSKTARFEVAA